MVDLIVHVVAIGAVVGWLEWRLRSYAALLERFDAMETRQQNALNSTVEMLLTEQINLNRAVDIKVNHHGEQMVHLVEAQNQAVLDTERSAIKTMSDTVGSALKTFSESVWKGVHNMALSVQLPASPLFTCFYCNQRFPVTVRERVGENDYCPEHARRNTAEPHIVARVRVPMTNEAGPTTLPWE